MPIQILEFVLIFLPQEGIISEVLTRFENIPCGENIDIHSGVQEDHSEIFRSSETCIIIHFITMEVI
jgi:hypothetical protein